MDDSSESFSSTGHESSPPPSPPSPPSAIPPLPPNAYPPVQYPEASQAVLSLVLSIVGVMGSCGILSPIGWYFGHKELQAIDAGRRDPSKRDMANAGRIIGIVGTVVLILSLVVAVGFFGILVARGFE